MNRFFKVIADNRKARFDYNIIETYNAGLVLKGTEVKSIRSGKVNLADSFGRVDKGEIWVYGIHISPYKFDAVSKINPTRPRKLLLESNEIRKLIGGVSQKGLTIVPLKLFLQGDWVKMEIALAKAKKTYEKRDVLKKRVIDREVERALSERHR